MSRPQGEDSTAGKEWLLFAKILFYSNFLHLTRPKPPYGRQGLAGSWSKDTVGRIHFKVFSTSNFATYSSVFLEFNFAFLQHI